MTSDEILAALRDDCVFELVCQAGKWRAFYRADKHHDISESPNGCFYRSVVRPTLPEAVAAAHAAWATEQVKKRLTK